MFFDINLEEKNVDLLDNLLDFIPIYYFLSLDTVSPEKGSNILQEEPGSKTVILYNVLNSSTMFFGNEDKWVLTNRHFKHCIKAAWWQALQFMISLIGLLSFVCLFCFVSSEKDYDGRYYVNGRVASFYQVKVELIPAAMVLGALMITLPAIGMETGPKVLLQPLIYVFINSHHNWNILHGNFLYKEAL